MTDKRTIHCDVEGTLIDSGAKAPAKNGPLILSFLQAAKDHGHIVHTASSIGCDLDTYLENVYGAAIQPFLPTLGKNRVLDTEHKPPFDILIDDKPILRPTSKRFHNCVRHWIDPNSRNLRAELQAMSWQHLGFKFTPKS